MNGHNIFKTPLIMMMIGLNCILGDLQLFALSGIRTAAGVWMERI